MPRIFVYDGREFPDPDPNLKVDEVRQHMANFFPELSNAESKESKRGEDTIIEFKKRVGTKGTFRMPGATGPGISSDVDTTPIVPKEEKLCRLGYCVTKGSSYQGGDTTVIQKLQAGICPICGGATEKKYFSQ